ncbi:neuronal acetylcholine receptor subunit beta-3-like [Mercenaria mercenaria]|uniref:neuronal acetylcholine receptor subunit beta-3-like n=1 Tax=Mercenaria mercenaria TaxID=6596 RepID=UPI00234E7CD4|nr:neuronal acetylcholine receptor subunit beta-3-like [Mercenaria mercenaria]
MPEVDPVRGAVKMGIMINQEWYDELITWTPADHGGISHISIKSEDVWTPPLTVANPVKFTLLDQPWIQVNFLSNGKASYPVGDIVEFSCSFYMKFWPFDKQVCTLDVFPYGYAYNTVAYSVPGPVINTDFYTKNGEWYLDEDSFETRIEHATGWSMVIYSFRIARQPVFYLLTIIIPINGIGALTCLVFLLPSESGERVSYSITIMLALAVFLTVISEDLPKNSEPIPIMCVYLLFNMVVCICGLILVILNLVLYHRSETVQISGFYRSLVKISRCGAKIQDSTQHPDDSMKMISINENTPNKQAKRVKKINNFTNAQVVSSDTDETITWKDVSKAIDKILFYALVVTTYVPSIIILTYIAAGSDYVTQ